MKTILSVVVWMVTLFFKIIWNIIPFIWNVFAFVFRWIKRGFVVFFVALVIRFWMKRRK